MRIPFAALVVVSLSGCHAALASSSTTPSSSRAQLPAASSAPSNDTAAQLPHNPNLELGTPRDSNPADDLILDRGAYVLSYNNSRRVPNWVAWRLRREDLGSAERSNGFHPDHLLPSTFKPVEPEDYEHTGFDRGHMCPSAHRTASEALNKITFLMTNMQPQLHALNAGPWKTAETHERLLAMQLSKELYIVAGGIFEDAATRSGISIPKANFRVTVVLDRGQSAKDVSAITPVYGLVMPNEASVHERAWTEYQVTVDSIEAATGYDFLSVLPDDIENLVEGRLAPIPS
jgi:endonuclease G